MNRDNQIAILIALAGFAAWLWFTKSGRSIAGKTAEAAYSTATYTRQLVEKLARGERNNNPGNIRISAATWIGKIPVSQNTDGAFEQFDTPENGIRALAKLLTGYATKYGLRTVRGIISRYAPPVENLTGAYVNAVASALQVSPDVMIDVNNPETLFALAKAIIKHENGRIAYDDSVIYEGVARAIV